MAQFLGPEINIMRERYFMQLAVEMSKLRGIWRQYLWRSIGALTSHQVRSALLTSMNSSLTQTTYLSIFTFGSSLSSTLP